MRHLRPVLVLLLAFALSAGGLLASASAAHRHAGSVAAEGFCTSGMPRPDPLKPHDCTEHCLAAVWLDDAAPGRATAFARVAVDKHIKPFIATRASPASPLLLDHAPRGPPVAA